LEAAVVVHLQLELDKNMELLVDQVEEVEQVVDLQQEDLVNLDKEIQVEMVKVQQIHTEEAAVVQAQLEIIDIQLDQQDQEIMQEMQVEVMEETA
jgi:hypothetical protein